MTIKQLLLGITLIISNQSIAQEVKISGAMHRVMKAGELQGTIYLDTLSNKKHLYGLGPKAYLTGELLIIDGQSYVSSIDETGSIKMEESFEVEAPFFVYANSEKWNTYQLPKTVQNLKELEAYIDSKTKNSKRPFVFKLTGVFSKVNFHIQNLPEGTIVKSPKDAHTGQQTFERKDTPGEIVGFFSTEHQSVFTHHNTFVHLHYINKARTEMGHLDNLLLDGTSEVILYLPIELTTDN